MKSAFWGEKSRASAVKGKPLGLVLSSGEVLGFWLVEMLSSPNVGEINGSALLWVQFVGNGLSGAGEMAGKNGKMQE